MPEQFTQKLKGFFTGNSRSVAVKKNIVASLLIRCFSIVVSLMVVPITLGYVSSELYGVWLTLSSIMVWLNFFDVGFTLGLKNKLAEALAQADYQRGKALVSTTYYMMIIIFTPLCILLEFTIPYIDWCSLLNVDIVYAEEIQRTIYVILLFVCLQMIVNVITSVVAAFQKVALSSALLVLGNVFSLIVIYIMTIFCPPSLVGLGLAFSAVPVLVTLASSIWLYSTRFKLVAPSFTCVDKSLIRDLFGLGAKFFLIQVQVVVMFQTTNILISNVAGPNDVTYYNIAHKYIGVAMMLYTIILSPLWPAFTDAYTKRDFSWMNRTYKKMVGVYAITAVIVVFMVIISPIVYSVWIGDRTEIPFKMTIVVGIYMLLSNWDSLQVQIINGIGAVKIQTYITLFGLIFHIPMAIFLGHVYGSYGVIYSMAIVNVVYIAFFTTQVRLILKQKAKGLWLK